MGNEMNELRYLDLKNTLCEKIYEGVYKDGEKIPSERQLSTDYDVSRITVRKTLELMEKENLIVREVGNGTRVTLKNYGNDNPLDVVALTAPSRNPFFAKFIAEFQKQAWEKIHYSYMWRSRNGLRWKTACTASIREISEMLLSGRTTRQSTGRSF